MNSASQLIDLDALPTHVAIIMDGNGRWAEARNLPRLEGHRRGVTTVRRIVKAADDIGIKYLTLYSFSTENWKRPKTEVSGLMDLFRFFIRKNLNELDRKKVRIKIIGEREGLDSDIKEWIDKAETQTEHNTGLTLIFAFNYGSRTELANAAQAIVCGIIKQQIDPDSIDETMVSQHLLTNSIPDPDLVIRTSGEHRISNFLLWQAAHAELHFTEVLWPDFQRRDLELALDDFQHRQH